MDLTRVVNLQGINKTYRNQVTALSAVNLGISKQEVIGIIGANGSGKSTLLKIIAGKLNPEQGTTEIFQLDALQHAEQLKSEISYISQDKALDPEMTGKESLDYFAALYGITGEQAKQRTKELINTFEMNEFIKRRINTYSGGQMQRLHLAIGIIHKPKLLLLDEPTSALDPSGKAFLWAFIQSYQQQGNTIIVVSHELENIRQYCSRVIMVDKGTLVADDTPGRIVADYSNPVLHISTAENIKDKNALKQLLLSMSSSPDIILKDQSARLEFSQTVNTDKPAILQQTLETLAEQHQTISECRWEKPGLDNAYFKLTGSKIKPTLGTPKNNNKKGTRKRH